MKTIFLADHQERTRPTQINNSHIFRRTSRFWWEDTRKRRRVRSRNKWKKRKKQENKRLHTICLRIGT